MATIYDVAKRANVSQAAVSAVLNGKELRISDTTKRRIMEAARDLNYRPNRAAQQLATGKFNTIALVFQRFRDLSFLNPFLNQLVAGALKSASEHDQCILFAPQVSEDSFDKVINNLTSHGIDGAVIAGPLHLDKKSIEAIDNCEKPLVCIDSYPGFAKASRVDMDITAGARKGIKHLISVGHSQIVYFGEPPLYQCQQDRMRSFYEVLQENEVAISENTTKIIDLDDVGNTLTKLLASKTPPTAIVCGSMDYAAEIWETATAIGVKIPGDLSLLSLDEFIPDHPCKEFINIVKDTPFEMGRESVDLLKKIIDREIEPPVTVRLMPKFAYVDSPVQMQPLSAECVVNEN